MKKSKQEEEENASAINIDALKPDVVLEATEEARAAKQLAEEESLLDIEEELIKHCLIMDDKSFFEKYDIDDIDNIEYMDNNASEEKKEQKAKQETVAKPTFSPTQKFAKRESAKEDQVDSAEGADSMLRSSQYDLQQRDQQSTIRKMIHQLSNDQSPLPQLTRTMVSSSPGFGHNNNRPFSYTRRNDSSSSLSVQDNITYAQVQTGKKKAQRSYSDSDEGLGLDRKESSRKNSPAEKECYRTDCPQCE